MRKTTILLTDLVKLFRQMQSRQWRDGRLYGEIVVADAVMATFLRELLTEESADDYPCLIEQGDPETLKVGDALRLGFGSPKTSIGLLVESVDALLKNREVAAAVVDYKWYVFEEDTASWEVDNDLCKRLDLVKRLIAALELSATLFDHRKTTLIFIRGGRFDVPVQYSAAALKSIDVVAAETLINEIGREDGHSKQRREICCTAVCELLASTTAESRFSELLNRMKDLRTRFEEGYKLFASSFSFEKIREEAETVRIEYTTKIHKTLADIQGQLLGIPVSTIVVATQFKDVATTPDHLWINIAVMTGATIFCFLLWMALWNQKHSLDVIADEVKRHEDGLKRQSEELAAKLSDVFVKLQARVFWHEVALAIIFFISIAAWLVGFAVFWMLSRSSL
jgi:hypothetical protein